MSLKIISTLINKRQFLSLFKLHHRLVHNVLSKEIISSRQILTNNLCNLQGTLILQKKYKQKKAKDKDEDEDDYVEIDVDESELSKASKMINTSVSSMRIDAVLKSGLGLSRNKIDVAFYESKVRRNGKKVLKKHEVVLVGDELDVVASEQSSKSSNLEYVSRVKVVAAKLDGDLYRLKLIRDKNLLVEKENQFG